MTESPLLTNALFTSGLQCKKRLYLEVHCAAEAPPAGESRTMMAEVGEQIVDLAAKAFPKGESVADDDVDAAIERTATLMADKKPRVVFHGRFRHSDVDIKTDILITAGDGTVDLFEVKAGVSIKPRHVLDLALQVWVLEQLGYSVRRTSILHLNRRYVHAGGSKYQVQELFKNVDATARVRRHVGGIGATLDAFRAGLADDATLQVPTGSWCRTPFPCVWLPRCRSEGPDLPLVDLPGLTKGQVEAMHEQGIGDLAALSDGFPGLTAPQRRALAAVHQGAVVLEPRLFAELGEWEPPIHFVWYECLLEVLPRFARSRPWQKIPFAWHSVALAADGSLEEKSFRPEGKQDPRAEFVTTLLESTLGAHTIVFWHGDVEDRLRELVEDLDGEAKAAARAMLNSPFLELQALLRSASYHPRYRGGFELDDVHAALADDAEDAPATADEIGAGVRRLANPRTRATTRDKLDQQLAEWNRHRAHSLLRIFRRLQQESPLKTRA